MGSKKVFLLPGELCVSKDPITIATLLGSCVAVVLYNRKQKCAGMNHFVTTTPQDGQTPSGKYGDYATKMIIKKMMSYDSNIKNIEASLFGGARMFDTGHSEIGYKNIIMAEEILKQYGIRVISKNVSGNLGRKIFLNTLTGEVEERKIRKSVQAKMIEEKKQAISSRKIKVLLVDDSKTIRDIMADAISQDPQIEVVGKAADPYEARELMLENEPDVICLDIIMPKLDGITFLKKLFLYKPKPVIIVSTVAQKNSKYREQAKEIGAVDVIDKEELQIYKNPDLVKTVLVNKIKTASTVWLKKKTKQELKAI